MSKKKSVEQTRRERAAAVQKEHQAKERRQRNAIVAVVLLVILAMVVGVGYGVMSSRDTTGAGEKAAPALATDKYGVVVGEDDAPVKVVVYEDFMCPACGQFEAAAGDYLAQRVADGDISVEYRMMSFLDHTSTNRYSTRAMNAYAAVLDTAGLDAAQRFHGLLYANQPSEGGGGLSDNELVEHAVTAGAKETQVRPLVKGLSYRQWVVNATDEASRDKVNQTPTVVVDGKTLTNPYQELNPAIEAALQD